MGQIGKHLDPPPALQQPDPCISRWNDKNWETITAWHMQQIWDKNMGRNASQLDKNPWHAFTRTSHRTFGQLWLFYGSTGLSVQVKDLISYNSHSFQMQISRTTNACKRKSRTDRFCCLAHLRCSSCPEVDSLTHTHTHGSFFGLLSHAVGSVGCLASLVRSVAKPQPRTVRPVFAARSLSALPQPCF